MPIGAPPEDPASHIPRRSWILRSKTRVGLFGALAGLVLTAFTSAADWFFYRTGQSPMIMLIASDALAGLLVALLLIGILDRIVDRTAAVKARLEMIKEMNHHVRNALQVIAYSAHSIQDEQAIAMINDAAQHIDWALREILGSGFNNSISEKPQKNMPDQRSA
jgi:hypothetical protein